MPSLSGPGDPTSGSRSHLIYYEEKDARIMPQKTTKPRKVVSKRENPKKNKGNKN